MKRLVAPLAGIALAVTVVVLQAEDAPPPAGNAPEKVTLKYQFVPGDYEQVQTTTSEQKSQVLQGQEVDARMRLVQDVSMHVGKPDDAGNKTVVIQFKRIRQKMSTPMGEISFDSAAEPGKGQDATQSKIFGALTKTRVTMTVNPENKVTGVSGMTEMWDNMTKAEPGMAPLVEQMKKTMGDEAMKAMIEKAAAQLPGREVAVGEKWQADLKLEVPIIGAMDIRQECKLKGVEQTADGKVAVIELNSKAESNKEQVTKMGPVEVKISKFSLDQTGELRVALDNAMLSRMTVKQTGSIEMSIPGPTGGMPMTSKFTQTIDTVTRKASPTTQPDE